MASSIDTKTEMTAGLTLFVFGLLTHFITKYGIFRVSQTWQLLIILVGLLILSHAIVTSLAANMKWLYLLVALILIGGGLWFVNSKYPLMDMGNFLEKEPEIEPYLQCTTDLDCLPSPYASGCCINKGFEVNITNIESGMCAGYLPDLGCECVIAEDADVGYCGNVTRYN